MHVPALCFDALLVWRAACCRLLDADAGINQAQNPQITSYTRFPSFHTRSSPMI